jgi:hypothetical protein
MLRCKPHNLHERPLMGQPIEITRTEQSASALRTLAGKTGDGAVVRRLLAIALILEGQSRTKRQC